MNAEATFASANNPTKEQVVATNMIVDPAPGVAAANQDQQAPLTAQTVVTEVDYQKASEEGGLTDPRNLDPNRNPYNPAGTFLPDRQSDGSSRIAGGDPMLQLMQQQAEINKLLLEQHKKAYGNEVEWQPEGEPARLLAAARVNAEAAVGNLSETEEGGRFQVPSGRFTAKGEPVYITVNAHGEEVGKPSGKPADGE
jgi:hypothetical protein